jgi:hypothetical protein
VIIEFREARASDVRQMVKTLRARDLEALLRAGDPAAIILEALQTSITCFTATADGVPAVMWGLCYHSMLNDQAYLWMLGTRIVDEHPVHFLRHSRAAMQMMRERYNLIYGECAVDFECSIRWLTWLGAKVWQPNPEGGGRLVFAIPGENYGT